MTIAQPSLSPQNASISRPRVSLCLIVKDEEANLAACLEPLREVVGEIVVVDTGSTDNTKAVAQELGAKVVDFAWADSFAAARNQGLDHAQGEWIFWLDADDRLDDDNRQRLRQLLGNLPQDNVAFLMKVYSEVDPLSGSAVVMEQVRLFRHHPSHRWSHRVHEQILPALQANGAKVMHGNVAIGHLGYQDPAWRRRKLERNLRLLQLELADNPTDPFTLFNLGGAFLDLGQIPAAMLYLERCLAAALPTVTFLPWTYALLIQGHRLLGQEAEAWRFCQEGRKRFPQAVELWFEEGQLRQARRDLAGAQFCYQQVLALPPSDCLVASDAGLQGFRSRHNLAVIYRDQGLLNLAEQQWRQVVRDCPAFGPAWLGLAELLLKQRPAEVQEMIAQLATQPANHIIVSALQARVCLSRRDVAGACEILQAAIAKTPGASWLRVLLAEILRRVGQDAAAEYQLREVLAQEPNHKQALRHLARLQKNRGGSTE